ncbi:right-handed parallel beta-helix repeat-containing protein [Cellulophaga baltica]|uniref:right-handed parallel beta-helix repeat-containing protein n=1 Tax=Cellulophaga baltica TaxID=76594 RepID=UPI00249578F1|nr:right-handed parallel beta-helix repeat-containing protein [Cellulophaga baltica]
MNIKRLPLLLFLLFSHSLIVAQTLYVATDGNDTNDGSIENPYKTFSKAITEMSAGDVCIIRGGIYEEELTINKSGTAGSYLTFKAAEGENVQIKATSYINGWQPHSGSIFKTIVDIPIESRFRAIYHNDEYMDLARWPNNTDNNRWTINSTPVIDGDGTHFMVDNLPNIDWTGGLVYYLGAHSGTSWTRSITSNTAARINYTGVDITKWPFTPHNPTVWRDNPGNNRGQSYVFNKLEALDYAREWYYEETTKTLYFQTADGSIPEDNTVAYARNKYTAQLYGNYIKLEGLNFFGGSLKIHNNADNNQVINCQIIHGSEGHDSLTNTSAQAGEAAIEVLGDNTVISGCIIDHSAVSGILIAGWAASNGIIEKNKISNIDYIGIHASPIRTSASNMKILKNTIFNTGRDGMYVNGLNSEVAYNDVSASQKINSDSGIFYTVGNADLKNIEIHHNWFHDATAPTYSHAIGSPGKAAGIYLDNNSKGYTVHHNVIWNISWSGYQVNWNNTNLDFYHNTIWNAERAMDSWVNGYTQENNKIYNNYSNIGDWFSATASDFDIQDNLINSISPFEDADASNFMPITGSPVVDKAQIIAEFPKPYKGIAPDIGAYELDGTRWTAGINAVEDTGEGISWSVLKTQFLITTSSETCPNQHNGKLHIEADFPENYTLNFNGSDTTFTKDTLFENLDPGTYDFCISIIGNTESQCFSIEIKEANEITGKSVVSLNKLSVKIEKGTAPFHIIVNEKLLFQTNENSFDVAVSHGDIVKVTSSAQCEGTLSKSIEILEDIVAYPNPTSGIFQISVPKNEHQITIDLYHINSQLVSSKPYLVTNGKVNLNLVGEPSGVYIVKINGKNPSAIQILKN